MFVESPPLLFVFFNFNFFSFFFFHFSPFQFIPPSLRKKLNRECSDIGTMGSPGATQDTAGQTAGESPWSPGVPARVWSPGASLESRRESLVGTPGWGFEPLLVLLLGSVPVLLLEPEARGEVPLVPFLLGKSGGVTPEWSPCFFFLPSVETRKGGMDHPGSWELEGGNKSLGR